MSKFQVGQRVSINGDPGEIVGADFEYEYPYSVWFDEGGSSSFKEEELEAAK